MLKRTAPRCAVPSLQSLGWLAAVLAVLLIPVGAAQAQDITSELEKLFGLTPGEEGTPAEVPPAEEAPPAEEIPGEAPPAELPGEGPAAPPSEEVDMAEATGYGAAGVPVDVAGPALQKDWRMMVHYFKIARYDLARQHGEAVLAASPDPKAVLAMTESPSTGYDLLVRMVTVEEMGDVPARILTLADEGMQAKKTDAGRIQANLLRLGKGPRPYYLAMKELKYSGPYVVPHALAVLQDPSKQDLQAFVLRALAELGRPVLLPLHASLDTPDAQLKEMILKVLGQIGHPNSLPLLKAVVENPEGGKGVKAAATKAILSIADESILRVPAKKLFLELAEKFYHGRIVVADNRQPTTDIFEWVPETGLLYRAAPSAAVNEILAARACADALRADPQALEAVSLWVSALMQMESQLDGQSAREAAPFLPDDMPSLDFFARAVGQQHLYKVLDRALREGNSEVATRACRALQDVANEEFLTLYGHGDVGSPLVVAMTYPDQRVRFAAAFALAAIHPKNAFTGAGKVVPTLAEALNLQAGRTVLLVEPESDNRNRLQAALKNNGWHVTAVSEGNEALSQARAMPRIDAVVLSSRTRNVSHADVVSLLRTDYATAMTPIVVLSYPDDPVKASWLEAQIRFVKAVDPEVSVEDLAAAIEELKTAAGSLVLAEEEARQVSLRAAEVLKEIAIGSRVYSARRARASLLMALEDRPDELVIKVLQALAEIPDGEVTRAMAAVAIDEDRSQPVRVAALQSLARAARYVGNELKVDQIDAIQALAGTTDDTLRDAAGEALGALNLDASNGAELILEHGAS